MTKELEEFIPIDKELEDFEGILDGSERCIFSARFGDGKSYFFEKFIEKYKKKYNFITIYPVNYQVADNKDIFEYIKRDILLNLLNDKDFKISDENKSSFIRFLKENKVNTVLDILAIFKDIPYVGTAFNLIKSVKSIKKNYDDYKEENKSEKEQIDEFVKAFENEKGSIYEFDALSQIISCIIKETKKPTVLIVEDLDRIDPEHIFRILNIFSAHFDRKNISKNKSDIGNNKFNFAKIITVCDYENIKNIYKHFYGEKTDFYGYISKFSSSKPFTYSLEKSFKDYILNTIIDADLKKPNSKLIDLVIHKVILEYRNNDEKKNNLRSIIEGFLKLDYQITNNLSVFVIPIAPINNGEYYSAQFYKKELNYNNRVTKLIVILKNFDLDINEIIKIDKNILIDFIRYFLKSESNSMSVEELIEEDNKAMRNNHTTLDFNVVSFNDSDDVLLRYFNLLSDNIINFYINNKLI